jgi:hypothetical protein
VKVKEQVDWPIENAAIPESALLGECELLKNDALKGEKTTGKKISLPNNSVQVQDDGGGGR